MNSVFIYYDFKINLCLSTLNETQAACQVSAMIRLRQVVKSYQTAARIFGVEGWTSILQGVCRHPENQAQENRR
jgi:hypothetical protein